MVSPACSALSHTSLCAWRGRIHFPSEERDPTLGGGAELRVGPVSSWDLESHNQGSLWGLEQEAPIPPHCPPYKMGMITEPALLRVAVRIQWDEHGRF